MYLRLGAIVLTLLVASCASKNDSTARTSARPAEATSFTGRLQSGVMGIGGEHTGWVLAGDGASGGIEVDVSKVKEEARANDGKRVMITGRMVEKNYTERGKVSVLVAERIKPAPKP